MPMCVGNNNNRISIAPYGRNFRGAGLAANSRRINFNVPYLVTIFQRRKMAHGAVQGLHL